MFQQLVAGIVFIEDPVIELVGTEFASEQIHELFLFASFKQALLWVKNYAAACRHIQNCLRL